MISDTLIWLDREHGWTLTHGFFALMGGFMEYKGDEPVGIRFYDPSHDYELESVGHRRFTALECVERRLAARIPESLQLPLVTRGPFESSLAALKAIKESPDAFKQALQRAEDKLHRPVDLEMCFDQVKQYNQELTDPSKHNLHAREIYETCDRRSRFESVVALLEAFESSLTIPKSEKKDIGDLANDTTYGVKVNQSSHDYVSVSMDEESIHTLPQHFPIPQIDEQDIHDKSKSDLLAKVIALFQVTWFVVQLCARYQQRLAITELEHFTLAFCVLSFATYALWWKKPFAVDRAYAIRRTDDSWELSAPPAPPFVETIPIPFDQRCLKSIRALWSVVRQIPMTKHPLKTSFEVVFERIPHGETMMDDSSERVSTFSPRMMKLRGYEAIIYYVSGCILILVFGSIHFLAWNSGPTPADKWVWRVCSIGVTILPMFIFLLELYANYFLDGDRSSSVEKFAKNFGMVMSTTPLFYVLARIGLLVLVIRSLMASDSDALQTVSWSQLMPHV